MKTVRIASRGSKLALWQTEFVSQKLRAKGLKPEALIIKTKGDQVQDRFLHEIGGKGVFVRELEQAILEGKADLGVHSLKDLPAILPTPFILPAILKRHSPKDVMIFRKDTFEKANIDRKTELTPEILANIGPISVGTASLRRQSLIKSINSEIKLKPVRGNVDTRIRKLHEGYWDAIILAEAAIDRLSLNEELAIPIATDWFIPSPAQGALALECCQDHPLKHIFETLNCDTTMQTVSIERAILAKLGGDCTMPIGSYLAQESMRTKARAKVLNYEGQFAEATMTFPELPKNLNVEETSNAIIAALRKNQLNLILKDLEKDPPDLGDLR